MNSNCSRRSPAATSSEARPASSRCSRRTLLKASAASLLMAATAPKYVFASGSDKLRVGLVGCGNRGAGAVVDCLTSNEGVELAAMGDLFKDRLDETRKVLKDNLPAERLRVADGRCFVGFDSYKHVIAADVDVVMLAAPAHFRAEHLKAAIEAGKHAFIEKPVAVDPVAARSIIASSELAAKRNLAVVGGTQRRHSTRYRETIARIHDGAIGELVGAQCCWFRGHLWVRERQPGWSDMEWQIRNFIYFTWLCGDCIVETLTHNIDVVNWAFGRPPVSVIGVGGRQVRTEPRYGHVYDHFAVEYIYDRDVRTHAACREMLDCMERVAEKIVGTKGVAYLDRGIIKGEKPYRCKANNNPYYQEQIDLIAGIRAGKPLNDGRTVAESTLTAIMGRMSAYTGQEVTWDFVTNKSKLDLSPPKYELCEMPTPPVAMPGVTKLI